MTTIERNFNGTAYRVTVKEEERRMAMEEDSTLQALEEAGSAGAGGPSSGLEESTVKVISLEVKVGRPSINTLLPGQERGVLLQRWQQEGGDEGEDQVGFSKDTAITCRQITNSRVNQTILRCASPRRDWVA